MTNSTHRRPPWFSSKILMIDGDAYLCALLRVHFELQGLELHHTQLLDNGLRVCEELKPDLVLLEIDVPSPGPTDRWYKLAPVAERSPGVIQDGIDVFFRLRSNPSLSSTPVIFLTHRPTQDAATDCLEAGADDFVTKPFSVTELIARVQRTLTIAGAFQRAGLQNPLAMMASVPRGDRSSEWPQASPEFCEFFKQTFYPEGTLFNRDRKLAERVVVAFSQHMNKGGSFGDLFKRFMQLFAYPRFEEIGFSEDDAAARRELKMNIDRDVAGAGTA